MSVARREDVRDDRGPAARVILTGVRSCPGRGYFAAVSACRNGNIAVVLTARRHCGEYGLHFKPVTDRLRL